MSTPAERLRAARIAKGFASAREAARHYGWSEVTYASHENGIRGLRLAAAQRYAKAFGIDVAVLLGMRRGDAPLAVGAGMPILGEAAVGVWRETVAPAGEPQTLPVPNDGARFAVRITDASFNKAIQQGEFAVCEPCDSAAIQPGHFVVIERRQHGLTERSVRRVVDVDGTALKLATHSTDTQYANLLTVILNGDASIMGRVVGKYTSFDG